MSKVRKRTWVTRAGEEHNAWVADYHAPGPDGKKAAAHETFKTRTRSSGPLFDPLHPTRFSERRDWCHRRNHRSRRLQRRRCRRISTYSQAAPNGGDLWPHRPPASRKDTGNFAYFACWEQPNGAEYRKNNNLSRENSRHPRTGKFGSHQGIELGMAESFRWR
jgi:hypothetical protein